MSCSRSASTSSRPAAAAADRPGQRTTPLARSSRPRIPHSATFTIASRIFDPLIFDSPSSRSVNVIGTSTTTNPLLMARQVRSIWKQ